MKRVSPFPHSQSYHLTRTSLPLEHIKYLTLALKIMRYHSRPFRQRLVNQTITIPRRFTRRKNRLPPPVSGSQKLGTVASAAFARKENTIAPSVGIVDIFFLSAGPEIPNTTYTCPAAIPYCSLKISDSFGFGPGMLGEEERGSRVGFLRSRG